MANRNTLSVAAPQANKQRAIQEAEVQQQMTNEKVKRLGLPQPEYQFQELIGKGSYGRVYKSLSRETNRVFAVKVLETDAMDFDMKGPNKDVGMEDALKEIDVLQRLKQSNAVNVNMFHEAFQIHSQLWIVSEYCPGGSLTTLRRATNGKLTERHIIPIARELASGLKSVHAAGIVHRDIKSSNVMISENGRVQIIDFGVAGILLSNLDVDKRKTVIGTPHWMPPEMQQNISEIAHGTEVDVWAYGITLFECATGAPPNANIMPGRQLKSQIRQNPAPRLSDDRFSPELSDLIACVLEPDPMKRPRMEEICEENILATSEEEYPTSSLQELVSNYYLWEASGGQRASLFMQGGAAQPKLLQSGGDDDEEWNFSTTANFEKTQNREIDRLSMNPSFKLGGDLSDMLSSSPPTDMDEEPFDQLTARYDMDSDFFSEEKPPAPKGRTPKGQSTFEVEDRVARGARAMQGLFDESASPYKYNYGPASDLPLRSGEAGSSLHRKELSVSSQNGEGAPQINLSNIPKKGGKRQTMNWKWEDNVVAPGGDKGVPSMPLPHLVAPDMGIPGMPSTGFTSSAIPTQSSARPQLKHSVTMPVGDRPLSETLDLDALLGDSFTLPRPQPSWSDPVEPSLNHAPPEADDDADSGFTMRPNHNTHGVTHSAQPSYASSSLAPSDTFGSTAVNSPYGSSITRLSQISASTHTAYAALGIPQPVNPAALLEGTTQETVLAALETGLAGWMNVLEALEQNFADESDTDSDDYDEPSKTPSGNGSGNWNFAEEGGPDTGGDDEGYRGGEENGEDDGDDVGSS